MQGTRFRILLKSLSASCISAHVDQYKKQSHGTDGTNNACKCETKKCDVNGRMVDKLREIACYTICQNAALGRSIELRTRLCDTDTSNDEKENPHDSTLEAEKKKVVEDILKKYHEAVQEYRSFDKNSCCSEQECSSDQSPEVSKHENVGITSKPRHGPAKEINDKDDRYSGNDRGNANNQDGRDSQYVHVRDIKAAIETFKICEEHGTRMYWIGICLGTLCGASVVFLTLAK